MSEQNGVASDPCESSGDSGGVRLPAEKGEAYISRHLEADEDRLLSAEEEAEILERLRALGYL